MSTTNAARTPLQWVRVTLPNGDAVEQARARNNSWYIVARSADGSYELRYASQSGNAHILSTSSIDEARRAADTHADRYDTRA